MAWLMAGEVIMSGGIFYDHLETNGTRRLRRLARLVRFMRAMGKRVIFFGVSIGPLTSPNGRLLTREILSHADGLWVRDALSVAFCREAGIECFHMPDLAAIFASRVAAMAACPTQEALFIPCGSGLDDGTHRRAIYTLQDTMRRYGLELKLLPIETRTDRPLAQRLSYQCGIPVAMKDESDPWRLMAHIKGARLVVSGRLHGGWGAYLCGRPLIQIDYHSKCRGLADSIHLPDPCLIDRRCDADDLRRAVALWLDSEEVHRPKLRAPEILENEVREAFGRLMIEMDSPGTNPKR
jgi:polysaccharide pyruvyl transferase WcaK-like protein